MHLCDVAVQIQPNGRTPYTVVNRFSNISNVNETNENGNHNKLHFDKLVEPNGLAICFDCVMMCAVRLLDLNFFCLEISN